MKCSSPLWICLCQEGLVNLKTTTLMEPKLKQMPINIHLFGENLRRNMI